MEFVVGEEVLGGGSCGSYEGDEMRQILGKVIVFGVVIAGVVTSSAFGFPFGTGHVSPSSVGDHC